MKTQWPVIQGTPNPQQIADFLREIVRLRQLEDLPDFTNLPDQYLQGRTVAKIPANANDVAATDTEGDTSYAVDGSYMYRLTDVSGTLTWARVALDTAW